MIFIYAYVRKKYPWINVNVEPDKEALKQKNATLMLVKLAGIDNINHLSLEENFNFLNSYLNVVSPVVRRFSGFIDKYLG